MTSNPDTLQSNGMHNQPSPWAGRYSAEREICLAEAPPEPYFTENLLVTMYDPTSNVGMWLHLGTYADDFTLWEEQVLICLPHEGLLSTVGVGRPEVKQRPAGPCLAFHCEVPFQRWRATFDGVGLLTPYEEMRMGLVRDGRKRRYRFDVILDMAGPVWDAQESATSAAGRGEMTKQVWAHDHYEQLYRISGSLQLEDRVIALKGSGLRDHSRGPRGGAQLKQFGGHTLIGVLYNSGRAFGLQRILKPDGSIAMDTAYVYVDGKFHHARVLELPTLGDRLNLRDEQLCVRLETELGEHRMQGELLNTSITTAYLPGMAYGADLSQPNPFIFAQGHVRWRWDGETGYGLTERSGILRGKP